MKTIRKKKHMVFPLLLVVIFVCFVFVRFIHLPESVGFGSDAGRDFLEIYSLVQDKKIKILGPSSQFAVDGYNFYFGPAPYYIMAPILIIGNWNIIFASAFLILANALILILSLVILYSSLKNNTRNILYPYAIFLTFMPLFIRYSQTYWNPHFMLPISTLLVSLVVWMRNRKTNLFFSFFIGFLWGVGLQFHYSFVLCVAVCLILIWKHLTIKRFLALTIGFVLGFLPIIVFELISQFYNLRTMLLFVTRMDSDSRLTGTPHYYFISLMPFVLFFISWLIVKLEQKYKYAVYAILSLFVIASLVIILPSPSAGYGMSSQWNYHTLKETAKIILNDNPTDYNIVDQRTGDNRAMALRYLLTTQGKKPKGVEEYPQSKTLYVYTHEPLDVILRNAVWEISSADVSNITTLGTVGDTTIYKFER